MCSPQGSKTENNLVPAPSVSVYVCFCILVHPVVSLCLGSLALILSFKAGSYKRQMDSLTPLPYYRPAPTGPKKASHQWDRWDKF